MSLYLCLITTLVIRSWEYEALPNSLPASIISTLTGCLGHRAFLDSVGGCRLAREIKSFSGALVLLLRFSSFVIVITGRRVLVTRVVIWVIACILVPSWLASAGSSNFPFNMMMRILFIRTSNYFQLLLIWGSLSSSISSFWATFIVEMICKVRWCGRCCCWCTKTCLSSRKSFFIKIIWFLEG